MLRMFEKDDISKIYSRTRPQPPESLISAIVHFVQEALPDDRSLAVDVGCGGGLSTRPLATHFTNVLGTDISAAQIVQAQTDSKQLGSVRYVQSPADVISVADNSAQLVTACEACQWFPDITKFFAEADRVLMPGGVLAIYGYSLGTAHKDGNPWKDMQTVISEVTDSFLVVSAAMKNRANSAQLKEINDQMALINKLYQQTQAAYVDHKYRLPYPEMVRDTISHHIDMDYHIEDLVDYFIALTSFMAEGTYGDAGGREEQQLILQQLREKGTAVISSTSDTGQADLASATVTLRFHYFLNMARKPDVSGSDKK